MSKTDIILGTINLSEMERKLNALHKENQLLKKHIAELKAKEPVEILQKKVVREMLGVTDKTLHNWNESGKLLVKGIGAKRYYLRQDVEKLLLE